LTVASKRERFLRPRGERLLSVRSTDLGRSARQ
jgi:hypothetical protein